MKTGRTASTKRRFVVSTLALLGALGLAIGSSHSDEVATIAMGVPIPLTGPFSSDGEVMRKGILLAVDELNAKGGLLGKKIKTSIFDIGDLTPDKLQAAAAQLLDREKVVALINGYGGMGPDIPAFCPYKQPYLNNDATRHVMDMISQMGCASIFNMADVSYNYGVELFKQTIATGRKFDNKKIAILHGPYDFEVDAAQGFIKSAQEAGWSIAFEQEVPYGTNQWEGMLSRIRKEQPAIIYLEVLDPVATSTFVSQYNAAPLKGTTLNIGYMLTTPAFGDFVKSGKLDGAMGWTPSAQLATPEGDHFVQAWKKAYNEDPPYSIGAQVYDEVMVWAAAVKDAGTETDFDKISNIIKTTKRTGATGTVDFKGGFASAATDATQPSLLVEARKGRVVPIVVGTRAVADPAN